MPRQQVHANVPVRHAGAKAPAVEQLREIGAPGQGCVTTTLSKAASALSVATAT